MVMVAQHYEYAKYVELCTLKYLKCYMHFITVIKRSNKLLIKRAFPKLYKVLIGDYF